MNIIAPIALLTTQTSWTDYVNAFSTLAIAIFTIGLFGAVIVQITTSMRIERAWIMAELHCTSEGRCQQPQWENDQHGMNRMAQKLCLTLHKYLQIFLGYPYPVSFLTKLSFLVQSNRFLCRPQLLTILAIRLRAMGSSVRLRRFLWLRLRLPCHIAFFLS